MAKKSKNAQSKREKTNLNQNFAVSLVSNFIDLRLIVDYGGKERTHTHLNFLGSENY